MLPEFKRLFVGNLPPGITETDLEKEFTAYGHVQKVEIKKKDNLVDPANPNVFAFVNLNVEPQSLNLCLQEFSTEKFRGYLLNVSVARESFLERLKREREENSKVQRPPQKSSTEEYNAVEKNVQKSLPKIEKHVESSDESEESSTSEDDTNSAQTQQFNKVCGAPNKITEVDDDIFIAKKRASSSLLNGKIKIQSVNNDPIHVISKNQKNVKRLDDKAKKSDQKRKDSQNKMKNQYNEQKLAIQKALAAVDLNKNKKILFDDNEMVNGDETSHNNVKKQNLFDEDDDELNNYEKEFEIKEQFQGTEGEKLMRLQSKYKLDSRFKLDERFLENDENEMDKKIAQTEEIDDERSWQLRIIEQVEGRKFDMLSDPHKKKLRKTMLRFDPNKEEHQKFIRNVEKVAQNFNENEKDKQSDNVEVSKDTFFSVNEDLTKSLKRRGDGFSLLNMFGRTEEENENQENNTEKYEEKILVNKPGKIISQTNPFKYDTSDSEDDNEVVENDVSIANKVSVGKQKTDGVAAKKHGIKTENLFFTENDERFKEGATFFSAVKRKGGEEEDYEKIKNKLGLLIKKKIDKSKKNIHRGFRNKNKLRHKK